MEDEEVLKGEVERAWDDVNEGWELPVEKVRAARAEEMAYMEGRNIWTVCPVRSVGRRLGGSQCR